MRRWINRTALVLLPALALAAGCRSDEGEGNKGEGTTQIMQPEVRAFLDAYQSDYADRWKAWTHAEWMAATTGKKEYFDAQARTDLALKTLHSDPEKYREIQRLLQASDRLGPLAGG